MTTGQDMENRIRRNIAVLSPVHLTVENESHRHRSGPGAETHFKVTVVSDAFSGKSLVERHRSLYQLLGEELKEGVHALALHCFTPQEWKQKGQSAASPVCAGGE